MALVRKGNVMTSIPEDRVQDYMARGYDVVNAGGAVLKRAVPTDTAQLQKEFIQKTAELAEVIKKYDTLMEQYKEVSDKYEKLLNRVDEKLETVEPEQVEPEQQTSTRGRKKAK